MNARFVAALDVTHARLKTTAFALGVAAFATGCFPLVTPPLKADGGGEARLGGSAGYMFDVGTHVASLIPNPYLPLDVGAGYVQTGSEADQHHYPVHGVYLEGGPRVAGGKNWRTFVGPRAEYYFAPQGPSFAYAGLVRASIEVFGSAEGEAMSSSDNKGFYFGVAYGTVAIGAWAEAGYQHLPSDAGLFMLGGGLHIRIPLTAGVVCCAWDFKSK